MNKMEDYDFDSLFCMMIVSDLEDYIDKVPMSYMKYAQVHFMIEKLKDTYMDEDRKPTPDLYFEEAQESIFDFLKHGDADHQLWLRKAIRNWFEGKEKPPVEGQE